MKAGTAMSTPKILLGILLLLLLSSGWTFAFEQPMISMQHTTQLHLFPKKDKYEPRSTVPIRSDDDPVTESSPSDSFFVRFNPARATKVIRGQQQRRSQNNIRPSTSRTDKFGAAQRIESVKCALVGAVIGSLAVAPVAYFHYADALAQWEFTTDMAAIQGALFAIVYRYAIRMDENPMLNQGVVGAFVLTRTLSNVDVPTTCSALPLQCGEPLGYVDWNILTQIAFNGAESAIMFGAVALVMDLVMNNGIISKFD